MAKATHRLAVQFVGSEQQIESVWRELRRFLKETGADLHHVERGPIEKADVPPQG